MELLHLQLIWQAKLVNSSSQPRWHAIYVWSHNNDVRGLWGILSIDKTLLHLAWNCFVIDKRLPVLDLPRAHFGNWQKTLLCWAQNSFVIDKMLLVLSQTHFVKWQKPSYTWPKTVLSLTKGLPVLQDLHMSHFVNWQNPPTPGPKQFCHWQKAPCTCLRPICQLTTPPTPGPQTSFVIDKTSLNLPDILVL